MAHGYYNLKGEFVTTATKAAATAAWRAERGYKPQGVFDMGGGEVVDTRKERRSAPATPKVTAAPAVPETIGGVQEDDGLVRATSGYGTTPQQPAYNVQAIQSLSPAPTSTQTLDSRLYNIQGTQSLATTPSTFYDVQSTQSLGAPERPISYATPSEQAAAQGGGVPEEILRYVSDPIKNIYSQYPYNVGAVGTPTEQRYGQKDIEGNYVGYGPTSYQWSESPGSLAELEQGRTPPGPALAAADTVSTFLTEWGVRPGFVTPFVAQSLGLNAADMQSMGYVEDLYGQWIALEFGDEELVGGDDYAGGYTGGGGGGGGYGSRSTGRSPTGFRSSYTSGLINWRIGF